MRDFFQHILSIFHRVDLAQLVLQRLGPHGVDRLLVHSTRVVIADLLQFWRGLWIGLGLCRFFRDRVQRIVVPFDQLIETAPARIFRRNFRALDPTAIGVEKEIVRRLHRRVHVRRINRLRILLGCLFAAFCTCFDSGRRSALSRRLCRLMDTDRRRAPRERRFLRLGLRLQSDCNDQTEKRNQKRFLHPTTVEAAVSAASNVSLHSIIGSSVAAGACRAVANCGGGSRLQFSLIIT